MFAETAPEPDGPAAMTRPDAALHPVAGGGGELLLRLLDDTLSRQAGPELVALVDGVRRLTSDGRAAELEELLDAAVRGEDWHSPEGAFPHSRTSALPVEA